MRRTAAHSPVLSVLAAILFVAASSCASQPTAQAQSSEGHLSKGPCLLRVHQDRAALMWETETKGPCKVYYGEGASLDMCLESIEGISPGAGQLPLMQKTAYIHKAWIKDLKPGRTYAYQIVGPDVRSEIHQFRTVPARTDEVRFVVYGDTRTNVQVHRRLVEQIMKHDLDFVVHVGDLVSRGDEYKLWGPQFFEPMKGLIERVPVYIVKGNHEGATARTKGCSSPPARKATSNSTMVRCTTSASTTSPSEPTRMIWLWALPATPGPATPCGSSSRTTCPA